MGRSRDVSHLVHGVRPDEIPRTRCRTGELAAFDVKTLQQVRRGVESANHGEANNAQRNATDEDVGRHHPRLGSCVATIEARLASALENRLRNQAKATLVA